MAKKLKQGAIVHYRLTAVEVQSVANVRAQFGQNLAAPVQLARGNPLVVGQRVPLVVVAVSGERVNGQALLDGTDVVWVQSAKEGDEPGEWSWGDKDDED